MGPGSGLEKDVGADQGNPGPRAKAVLRILPGKRPRDGEAFCRRPPALASLLPAPVSPGLCASPARPAGTGYQLQGGQPELLNLAGEPTGVQAPPRGRDLQVASP